MNTKNNDKNKSFITKMTEKEKIIFIKTMVAVAHKDSYFSDEEMSFIKDATIMFGLKKSSLDEILSPITDNKILKEVSKITDRQVALQLIKEICLLANYDGNLSDEEICFIGKIGEAMKIELNKVEEISQWVIDKLIWLERGKIIFEQV